MRSRDRAWMVDVVFTESDRATRADVILEAGGHHYHAWGRSRRDPADPDVPRIGEEVAAARALADLSEQLLAAASAEIGDHEGHAVAIHT